MHKPDQRRSTKKEKKKWAGLTPARKKTIEKKKEKEKGKVFLLNEVQSSGWLLDLGRRGRGVAPVKLIPSPLRAHPFPPSQALAQKKKRKQRKKQKHKTN